MSLSKDIERSKAKARLNYAINRKDRLKNKNEWLNKENNHKIVRESYHKWEKENPQKYRAWLVAKRLIPLKGACEICGGTDRLQRHHKDYGKPLEVLTLCEICHNALEVIEPPICTEQPDIRYYRGGEPVEVLDHPRIKLGEKWPCRVLRTGEIKYIVVGSLWYIPHKGHRKKPTDNTK